MNQEVGTPSLKNEFYKKPESEVVYGGLIKGYPNLKIKNQSDVGAISKIVTELQKSERGKELLHAAEKNNTWVAIKQGMASQGSYCEKQNRVLLNPSIGEDKLVITFAHELRHAEQFNTTIDLDPVKDTVKTYLSGMFAIEADANAHSALVAWEIKEKGNDKPFSAFLKESPHIVTPFEKEASKGNMPLALDAAFNGWYDNMNIRRAYEKNYCGMLKQNNVHHSKDPEVLSRDISPEETVSRTCVYNGKNYFKDNPKKLVDKDHLSLGHETWWTCWRTYRDVTNRNDWNNADKNANTKMGEVPRREGNDDYYYSISPQQAKEMIENRQEEAKQKIACIKGSSQKNGRLPISIIKGKTRN